MVVVTESGRFDLTIMKRPGPLLVLPDLAGHIGGLPQNLSESVFQFDRFRVHEIPF